MSLIDREILLEAMKHRHDYVGRISDDVCLVEDAPEVEAQPIRYGQWIKMTGMLPPECHGHYACSECWWHLKGLRNSWPLEEEMKFCPNCGAKMTNALD